MNDLPPLAISIRQPWAWAVVKGFKTIENRHAQAVRYLRPFTGPRAVHAAKGMLKLEYETAAKFMAERGVICPAPHELLRGGIIGSVEITACVQETADPWFFNLRHNRGLVLENAQECDFIPSVGQLGYFNWHEADQPTAPELAKWMLPKAAPVQVEAELPEPSPQKRLPL